VFSVYDAGTDTNRFELRDNDEVCIFPPYNVEAKFCRGSLPQKGPKARKGRPPNPIQLKLARGDCTAVQRKSEREAPYFLWGRNGTNVLPNTQPLYDGGYYLYAQVGGVTTRIRFTQCCGIYCPDNPFPKQCARTI
jgi:hypothetical protein